MSARKKADGIDLNGHHEARAVALTKDDLRDVEAFRERAKVVGYDWLAVHSARVSEDANLPGYVSAHRIGEPWSTWAFGRDGSNILAWNALDGQDAGTFSTMLKALEHVLLGPRAKLPVIDGKDR